MDVPCPVASSGAPPKGVVRVMRVRSCTTPGSSWTPSTSTGAPMATSAFTLRVVAICAQASSASTVGPRIRSSRKLYKLRGSRKPDATEYAFTPREQTSAHASPRANTLSCGKAKRSYHTCKHSCSCLATKNHKLPIDVMCWHAFSLAHVCESRFDSASVA